MVGVNPAARAGEVLLKVRSSGPLAADLGAAPPAPRRRKNNKESEREVQMNKSRPKQLSFRVSEEEYKQFQEKVAESGKNQQEYILSCVLGKEIVNTDAIREIVPEMKRQGANLNQLVKKLNERGYIDYKKELPMTLEEVRAVWQLLKQYLQKQA